MPEKPTAKSPVLLRFVAAYVDIIKKNLYRAIIITDWMKT